MLLCCFFFFCCFSYFCRQGSGLQGIRLADGRTGPNSRVEILQDDQWGTVCGDDQWDLDDARVVCQQLGYHNATNSYRNASGRFAWMSKVQCQGNETSISSCRHERSQQENCPMEDYAGLHCKDGYDNVTFPTVRFR
ncbi:Neurotrypsin [Holothuria leucospilota]|uniref:Neurotrypsin n=1 Tax=Holothuria leucospilota TaxID=206669 RepID=A0A9Q1BWX9_HOLLE|nr:Neurotrypsin [Holothuria leucospilota]